MPDLAKPPKQIHIFFNHEFLCLVNAFHHRQSDPQNRSNDVGGGPVVFSGQDGQAFLEFKRNKDV